MSARNRKRLGAKGIAVNHGPIMAHVGFEGSRHMHPERIPTPKHDKTTSLRLFDVTKDTLENIEKYSGDVKRLMVPGLKLNLLSDALIDKMIMLEKLDLGENQLSDGSLPESFKKLDNLIELNLNHNKFTKVPSSVKRLKNLTRLNLSHNNLDSIKGIEKLRKMQILMVDHNNLSSVFKDVAHMRKLEILDCSDNRIREVGLDVRNLKHLKELNISKNKITVLPKDLFQLPRLESLKASQNQISKVPVFSLNPQNAHCLTEVDLSGNAINKFPDHLLQISKKLDVASNKIRVLDWSKMKKTDMSRKQELFLDGNPLTYPPVDVCECGLKSMMRYFQETQANVKVYQGVKVQVLGASDSGKTSFVQSLVDGQARLSEEMYEKSTGIEATDMSFNHLDANDIETSSSDSGKSSSSFKLESHKALNLCLWDFCGHPFYLYPHYLFYEQPAITILTFNMYQYKSELFDEMIGAWFDWMLAKTNKLTVVLVGTHADKITKEQMTKVNKEVVKKLAAHLEKQREIVQKRIRVITEKPHISQTLSTQLNSLSVLLQDKCTVQSEVVVTSASKYVGYDVIRESIENLANDTKLFPNVMRTIPTFWLDVETFTEEKGNTMTVPVMTFDDYREIVSEKFGMKHLLPTIVQYLHDTGKVMWFSSVPSLKNFIFLRPAWLFDIFRSIFRHDLKVKLDVEVEDSYKTIGIYQTKYDGLKEEFLKEGIVDKDLLKCILSRLLPLETNGPFYEVVDLMLNNLDVGYYVCRRIRERDYNLDPDLDGPNAKQKILIPWFRKVAEPDSVAERWEPLADRRKLSGVCRFPKYMPPGLFEMLSVRAHREKHNLKFLAHWGGGFHARHKTENVQVMFAYDKHEDDSGTTLRFELRDDGDINVDEVAASTMWSILLPVLLEFEELLQSYSGVLVERLMECPLCHELSFLGEWMTPKETQGMETRPCEECMQDVDTAFLVQPREKKRGKF